jgi:anti-sigma factor ChrR (cupin superfamily)
MLTCHDVTRLVASDQLQSATWRTRVTARIHLAICRHCRQYAAQLRAIGHAAKRWAASDQEEAAAVRRALERVGREAGPFDSSPPSGG